MLNTAHATMSAASDGRVVLVDKPKSSTQHEVIQEGEGGTALRGDTTLHQPTGCLLLAVPSGARQSRCSSTPAERAHFPSIILRESHGPRPRFSAALVEQRPRQTAHNTTRFTDREGMAST